MKPGLGSGVWRCGSLGVCFRVWGLTCFGVLYMFLCVLCPFSISLHTFTHRKEFFLVRLANFFLFFLLPYMFLCVFCPFSISLHTFTYRKEFFLVQSTDFFRFFFSVYLVAERNSFSSGQRFGSDFFFLFFLFYLLAEKNSFASGRRMCSLTGKDR